MWVCEYVSVWVCGVYKTFDSSTITIRIKIGIDKYLIFLIKERDNTFILIYVWIIRKG